MHFTATTIPLAFLAINTVADQPEAPGNTQLQRRQASLACDEVYGEGFVKCGGPESKYCYNPSIGQTCCHAELGFCDVGYFCAPIAGFCCLMGETDDECARGAGFQVLQDDTEESDPSTIVVLTTTLVTTITLHSEATEAVASAQLKVPGPPAGGLPPATLGAGIVTDAGLITSGVTSGIGRPSGPAVVTVSGSTGLSVGAAACFRLAMLYAMFSIGVYGL